MNVKRSCIVFDENQGAILVQERHNPKYSMFSVDTFQSNYDITSEAQKRVMDVFRDNLEGCKPRCFFSCGATYLYSPKLQGFGYSKVYNEVMAIIRDVASYHLIGGRVNE